MKFVSAFGVKNFLAVFAIAIFLTAFFYVHEQLPKPVRAITSLLETPIALISGLFHYLSIPIPVYESFIVVVVTNLISAFLLVLVVKLLKRRKQLDAHKSV